LKCHYLAAFTAAILNNQPMGFYSPATLVKDAQRHGLKVKPIDVTKSDWLCTLESGALRIGMRYVKGMRESAARSIVDARSRAAFTSVDDLARRAPELQKRELVMLAEVGALNFLSPEHRMHRRDALWQVERASRRAGPLLQQIEEPDGRSPLSQMTPEERLVADFHGAGMTIGPHPVAYYRENMNAMGVLRASDLAAIRNGARVRVAGAVIARQRPGTAKGFVFISLEDETGISNIIVHPEIFERNRFVITQETFLLIEGILQARSGTVHIRAEKIERLPTFDLETARSHDFQ